MVPEAELPVLESFVGIRNRLTALKQERTEYLKAKDVLDIYASLMTQVNRLNEIRSNERDRQVVERLERLRINNNNHTEEEDDELVEEEEEEEATTPEEEEEEEDVQVDQARLKKGHGTENVPTTTTTEENRVDTILNDVFQLLSLFFLRIGKSRESPAAFCQLGTMKRLLTHLNESGIYTEADLKPYQTRLIELREIIREGDPANKDSDERRGTKEEAEAEKGRDEAMTKLMYEKWDTCDKLVKKLSTSLTQLSPELYPLHQRLITLRRQLAAIAAKPRPQPTDVTTILTELRMIEDKRNANGKFVVEKKLSDSSSRQSSPTVSRKNSTTTTPKPSNSKTMTSTNEPTTSSTLSAPTSPPPPPSLSRTTSQSSTTSTSSSPSTTLKRSTSSSTPTPTPPPPTFEPPKGQALLAGLLQDNFDICEEIKARRGEEDVARGPLQPIYDRLSGIKGQLERLVLTHRWTLRETDLYNFQNELARVDALRVDGKFRDAEGNVPEGQIVLLYLLRRCYGLCYRLMASSEPVSEELMPISNKLNTIKRCLIEVAKQGGPYTPRDLYPFQLALYQIDSLRKDGKFEGRDGSIPEGQAILNALLSESHEICEMLLLSEDESE